jgi:hypothetical protein
MNPDRFQIIAPKDREDYRDQAGDLSEVCWPEFMLHDPVANESWHELFDRFEDYQFALWDTETNRMAAMGNSLPFHWDKDLSELPEGGWDWVFLQAIENHKNGVVPNIQSAIQIAIHPRLSKPRTEYGDGQSHAFYWAIQRLQKSRRAGATEPKEPIPAHQH